MAHWTTQETLNAFENFTAKAVTHDVDPTDWVRCCLISAAACVVQRGLDSGRALRLFQNAISMTQASNAGDLEAYAEYARGIEDPL